MYGRQLGGEAQPRAVVQRRDYDVVVVDRGSTNRTCDPDTQLPPGALTRLNALEPDISIQVG